MSNMAAEHSVMTSSSSFNVSEVLRLRDLKKKKHYYLQKILFLAALISFFQNLEEDYCVISVLFFVVKTNEISE